MCKSIGLNVVYLYFATFLFGHEEVLQTCRSAENKIAEHYLKVVIAMRLANQKISIS